MLVLLMQPARSVPTQSTMLVFPRICKLIHKIRQGRFWTISYLYQSFSITSPPNFLHFFLFICLSIYVSTYLPICCGLDLKCSPNVSCIQMQGFDKWLDVVGFNFINRLKPWIHNLLALWRSNRNLRGRA